MLLRCWGIVAGAGTILLLPFWLTPLEQGYYYTFASVLALQIFFELGLNQIVVQLVSHEVAHLEQTREGVLKGNKAHIGKLSSLVQLMSRWYAVAAILFAIIGGGAGALFFIQKGTEAPANWLNIWALLVSSTAINLWLSPGLAVMEGCGKVGHVARLRLMQSITAYLILWSSLILGAGLWVIIVVPLVCALCTAYWLKKYALVFNWLKDQTIDINNKIKWTTEVFPLQWRIALSWASGYLIFNLFVPVAFSKFGAIEAGRLGMALTIFSAISAVGMSWVNAKAHTFTRHIARGERDLLNALFKRVFFKSFTAVLSILLLFLTCASILIHLDVSVMNRIASMEILISLAIATIANAVVFSMATFMRSHIAEPMLRQSISIGILTLIAIIGGSEHSLSIMMYLYGTICLFISLPWTIILFLKYYNKQ